MGTLTMDTCGRTRSKPARPQLCQSPTAPAGGGSAQPWEHRDEHWDIPGDSRWWLCSGEGQGGTHAGTSWPSVGWDEPWQMQSSPKSGQLQVPLPAALQEELGDTVRPQLPPSHVPHALAARAAHWGHCWAPAVPSSTPQHRGIHGNIGTKTSSTSTLTLPNWAGTGTAPLGAACAAGGTSGKGRREMWMLPAPALPHVFPHCSGQSLHGPVCSSCPPPGNSGMDGPGPCPSPMGDQCLKPVQKATSPF